MSYGLQWPPSMGQPVIRAPAAGRVFFVRSTGNNGNNPYRDLNTGALATCLNGWVDNHAGNALSAGPAIM